MVPTVRVVQRVEVLLVEIYTLLRPLLLLRSPHLLQPPTRRLGNLRVALRGIIQQFHGHWSEHTPLWQEPTANHAPQEFQLLPTVRGVAIVRNVRHGMSIRQSHMSVVR